MSDWSDVEATIAEHSRLYNEMLHARQEHQAGSKKVRQAEEAWLAAHSARAEALMNHWTEEDGYLGEFKRMGPVLQRYYAETATTTPRKGGK